MKFDIWRRFDNRLAVCMREEREEMTPKEKPTRRFLKIKRKKQKGDGEATTWTWASTCRLEVREGSLINRIVFLWIQSRREGAADKAISQVRLQYTRSRRTWPVYQRRRACVTNERCGVEN